MAELFDLFKKIEKAPALPLEPVSFLLVGLGNPGKDYLYTRHNAGFMTVDFICDKLSVRADRAKFSALVGECVIAGKRGLIVKPQTYMNDSGEAVRDAAAFYKIPPERVIVICDDVNLDPGKLRVRRKGSDGGQKGLRSIIYHLNSDAFPRVRMGVGAKPHPDYDLADWVLGKMPEADQKVFFDAMGRAFDAVKLIAAGDIDKAMNLYN